MRMFFSLVAFFSFLNLNFSILELFMEKGLGNNNDRQEGQRSVRDATSMDDSSSPFFLYDSNHPGMNLILNPLAGANYPTWQCNA